MSVDKIGAGLPEKQPQQDRGSVSEELKKTKETAKILREHKRRKKLSEHERNEYAESFFQKYMLRAEIKENFATLETFNDTTSRLEAGIEDIEKYGYRLAGPISITYIPDEHLLKDQKTGGTIMQKATLIRIELEE